MNNSNPFVPQGSVLEQNKRRSRMKLAVSCVLAVSVAGLSAILISSCKREQTPEAPPLVETNPPPMLDTNPPPVATNPPVFVPPMPTNPPGIQPVETEAAGTYTVVKGDTLAKIAKAHGVTLKALEDANLGVVPTKLKIGQKLNLPSSGAAAPAATGTTGGIEMPGAATGSGETYVVKSGDTLAKIAKAHGVTLKTLEAANPNVDPNHIKVGLKLNIPAKAEAAAPAPVPVPASVASPAPAVAPVTTPAPAGTSN